MLEFNSIRVKTLPIVAGYVCFKKPIRHDPDFGRTVVEIPRHAVVVFAAITRTGGI